MEYTINIFKIYLKYILNIFKNMKNIVFRIEVKNKLRKDWGKLKVL